MKKTVIDYVKIALGLTLLIGGLILIKQISNPTGIMKALPFVMVGLGCGIFGEGMGNAISKKAMKKSPEIAKQIEIDTNDERNIAISNKAKSKAYDIMTFVFGALMLSFALMQIDIIAILLLVFTYLFVQGCGIFYRIKYDREM